MESDTTTVFPDVPEKWIYEDVAVMAKWGLVEGYPDSEFKGNRAMTSYEFASSSTTLSEQRGIRFLSGSRTSSRIGIFPYRYGRYG